MTFKLKSGNKPKFKDMGSSIPGISNMTQVNRPDGRANSSAFQKEQFPTRPLKPGEGKPKGGGITAAGVNIVKSIGKGIKSIFKQDNKFKSKKKKLMLKKKSINLKIPGAPPIDTDTTKNVGPWFEAIKKDWPGKIKNDPKKQVRKIIGKPMKN